MALVVGIDAQRVKTWDITKIPNLNRLQNGETVMSHGLDLRCISCYHRMIAVGITIPMSEQGYPPMVHPTLLSRVHDALTDIGLTGHVVVTALPVDDPSDPA